jgi:hypothetical protein
LIAHLSTSGSSAPEEKRREEKRREEGKVALPFVELL